jgi:uracil-DNA glycosylase
MRTGSTRLDRNLDALRRELQQCRRCGHPENVHPIISIARAPRTVLVGQAPGKTEAGGGRPFAGRAGRTLFQWLAGVGIDEVIFRERVQISAITRCYPGPSASGRGDRVPGPAERQHCSGWLAKELDLIRPSLIIPVGRLAIDAFLGSEPLDSVIGREHVVTLEGGRTSLAIPLPHPSGASSWIHIANHRTLLEAALTLIAERWAGIEGRGRRVA